MPLDGKIEQFTRTLPDAQEADSFSRTNFIAWLETQPAHHEYCWLDAGHCLLAKFGGQVLGIPENGRIELNGYYRSAYGHANKALGDAFEIAVASQHPRTFGAALARARSLESAAYAP